MLLPERRLKRALLRLPALPSGWSQDPPSPGGEHTFCNYDAQAPKERVSRTFTRGGGLAATLAGVGLRQYASAEQAGEAFAAMVRILRRCHAETLDGDRWTYRRMNVGEVGDSTLGERTLGVRLEGTATMLQRFALVGPVIVNAGVGGLTSADPDLAETLLRRQDAAHQGVALP